MQRLEKAVERMEQEKARRIEKGDQNEHLMENEKRLALSIMCPSKCE